MRSILCSSLLKSLGQLPDFPGRLRLVCLIASSSPRLQRQVERGVLLELDPREWLQRQILIYGFTEPLTTALLSRLLTSKDVFIDVGCYIGYFSCIAAEAVGPGGVVVSIDPQWENLVGLRRNRSINGFTNIISLCALAGSGWNIEQLRYQSDLDRASLSMLDDTEGGDSYLSCSVSVDSIIEGMGVRPKCLKIDAEGAEHIVLQGTINNLGKIENIIFEELESTDSVLRSRVRELMRSSGYELFDVVGAPITDSDEIPERNIWARLSGSN